MKIFPALLTLASFASYFQPIVADNVCSSGLYAALAPLYNSVPAVNYCKGQVDKVMVTATAARKVRKRAPKSSTITTSSPTKKTSTTTPVKISTTKTATDAKPSSWSSLVAQAKEVVATFCSYAGYPATITVCRIDSFRDCSLTACRQV